MGEKNKDLVRNVFIIFIFVFFFFSFSFVSALTWNGNDGSSSGSSYNSTYASWSYNQTIATLTITNVNITALNASLYMWLYNQSLGVHLNEILNPYADKTFSMGQRSLSFNFVNPSGSPTYDGAFEIQASGAFTGDLTHIHQHTGNPGVDTDLLHLEASDVDVLGLNITTTTGKGAYINGELVDKWLYNQTLGTDTSKFLINDSNVNLSSLNVSQDLNVYGNFTINHSVLNVYSNDNYIDMFGGQAGGGISFYDNGEIQMYGNLLLTANVSSQIGLFSKKVAIGLANPTTLLELGTGDINLTQGRVLFRNGYGISNSGQSGAWNNITLYNNANGQMILSTWFGTATAGGYLFKSANLNRVIFTGGGNVGINTITPSYMLEINNDTLALNVSNILFVNKTNIGIGIPIVKNAKLEINSATQIGLNISNTYTSIGYGIKSYMVGNGVPGIGVYGEAQGIPSYGVIGNSSIASNNNNYGVYGVAKNGAAGSAYGVYGVSYNGSSTTVNYAGYFEGDVYGTTNGSFLTLIDRSKWCDISGAEALTTLTTISKKIGTQDIDKTTMPNCAVVDIASGINNNTGEVIYEKGRDIGAYISYLTIVAQEQQKEIEELKARLNRLEGGV